jgi:hypothetical protein
MRFQGWDNIPIQTDDDSSAVAVAPVVVSASRRTDIPAFYPEWIIHRLNLGYVKWMNPFNGKSVYVSFNKTRLIVFWSKNPEPLIPFLKEIDQKGIHYYFQFTLNDYEEEGFEPGVPPLADRIESFRRLSDRLGKGRVIWRFDPLILTDTLTVDGLLDKIHRVGEKIYKDSEKLVISFVDIALYGKVRCNLQKHHPTAREFNDQQRLQLIQGLLKFNQLWNLEIAACGEAQDYTTYGVKPNRCIDDALMIKQFSSDTQLMDFMGYRKDMISKKMQWHYLKDKHQRKSCGCMVAKDIGSYDTCGHGCVYCYACSLSAHALNSIKRLSALSESLMG